MTSNVSPSNVAIPHSSSAQGWTSGVVMTGLDGSAFVSHVMLILVRRNIQVIQQRVSKTFQVAIHCSFISEVAKDLILVPCCIFTEAVSFNVVLLRFYSIVSFVLEAAFPANHHLVNLHFWTIFLRNGSHLLYSRSVCGVPQCRMDEWPQIFSG